jgi:predicted alpha/beta-fold hydrolase
MPFPPFRPHRLFRSGHAQTLAGAYWPEERVEYRAARHQVPLTDGDVLIVHDDRPEGWLPGGRVALLLHGLVGSHLSGYMVRVSRRLVERGVRTFRLDLRGCGAGAGLARRPYSAGCSDDVLAAIQQLETLCPASPIALVGFSLSGNVLLKYLGESLSRVSTAVDRAMAVNPPIDLKASVLSLDRFANRFYGRFFVRQLQVCVERLRQCHPDVVIPSNYRSPRRLYDFDDQYTAPMIGFDSAADYYARCSANQYLKNIAVPTLILTAQDDPLVPLTSFDGVPLSASTTLHIAEGGGHLGYIAARGLDPDRRWMDWRIVDWVLRDARQPLIQSAAAGPRAR